MSRAVLRLVVPGVSERCAHCGERIGFRARVKRYEVIANVYKRKRWDRVEHFHDGCYVDAGEPYGSVDASQVRRVFVTKEAS